MPDLEYTIEISSESKFELPSAEDMGPIVHQAILDWAYSGSGKPPGPPPYLAVEVTRVSDDL